MLLDAGQAAEDVTSLRKCIVDTLVLIGAATIIIRIGNSSLGNGVELDNIAIARLAVLVGSIGAHIIFGGRLQALEVKDDTVVAELFGADGIGNGGFGLLTQAETTLLDGRASIDVRTLYSSEGHRGPTGKTRIRNHLGSLRKSLLHTYR